MDVYINLWLFNSMVFEIKEDKDKAREIIKLGGATAGKKYKRCVK